MQRKKVVAFPLRVSPKRVKELKNQYVSYDMKLGDLEESLGTVKSVDGNRGMCFGMCFTFVSHKNEWGTRSELFLKKARFVQNLYLHNYTSETVFDIPKPLLSCNDKKQVTHHPLRFDSKCPTNWSNVSTSIMNILNQSSSVDLIMMVWDQGATHTYGVGRVPGKQQQLYYLWDPSMQSPDMCTGLEFSARHIALLKAIRSVYGLKFNTIQPIQLI